MRLAHFATPFLLALALAGQPLRAGSFRLSDVYYEVWEIDGHAAYLNVMVGATAIYVGSLDPEDDGWLIQTFLNDSLGDDMDDWLDPDSFGYGATGTEIPYSDYVINCDPRSCGASLAVPKCDAEDRPVSYKGRGGVTIYHQFFPEIDIRYAAIEATDCDEFSIGGRVVAANAGGSLGEPVKLSNNGNDWVWTRGPFEFPQKLRDGETYDVRVAAQPKDGRRCWVELSTGTGVIDGADVEDVIVSCVRYCKATRSVVHYPGTPFEAGARCRHPSFADNGDGTVSDLANDLLWVKTPETRLNGNAAQTYCSGVVIGEWSDWYLPDVAQLQTLLPPGTCHGALDECGTGEPDVPFRNAIHWSRSHGYTSEYCPAGFGCYGAFWAVATGYGEEFGADCNRQGCPPRERVYWMDVPEGGHARCVADLHRGDLPSGIGAPDAGLIFADGFELGLGSWVVAQGGVNGG